MTAKTDDRVARVTDLRSRAGKHDAALEAARRKLAAAQSAQSEATIAGDPEKIIAAAREADAALTSITALEVASQSLSSQADEVQAELDAEARAAALRKRQAEDLAAFPAVYAAAQEARGTLKNDLVEPLVREAIARLDTAAWKATSTAGDLLALLDRLEESATILGEPLPTLDLGNDHFSPVDVVRINASIGPDDVRAAWLLRNQLTLREQMIGGNRVTTGGQISLDRMIGLAAERARQGH